MVWYVINNELYHHGVPGMKWGVRRDRTSRPHSRTKTTVSGAAKVQKGTRFGKELNSYTDSHGTHYRGPVSGYQPLVEGRGYNVPHTIAKNQGKPARAPKYANPHTMARFRGTSRPHTASQVVSVKPKPSAGSSGSGASPPISSEKWEEAINDGKKFVSSLFDKKWELDIGNNHSITVKKKGKISKAIDAGKKWLATLFKKG